MTRWRCRCAFPDGHVEETLWLTQDGADQMESEMEAGTPGVRCTVEPVEDTTSASRVTDHHEYCGWHWDQYDSECDCGATRPKAVWFDAYVRECDEAREEAGIRKGSADTTR